LVTVRKFGRGEMRLYFSLNENIPIQKNKIDIENIAMPRKIILFTKNILAKKPNKVYCNYCYLNIPPYGGLYIGLQFRSICCIIQNNA